MNSGIQLNTILENKSLSGNSLLALTLIDEITMLNLHLTMTHIVSAAVSAKLYIHR